MKELKLDASAEDIINKAWLVNESIKDIAKEMSPGARSKLLQAGILSQCESLLGYNIPRTGELFPDSIRQSLTENESNHANWHEMNLPGGHDHEKRRLSLGGLVRCQPQGYYGVWCHWGRSRDS